MKGYPRATPRSKKQKRKPVLFTEVAVRKMRPEAERIEVRDAGSPNSLFLCVQPSGHKSWVTRYKLDGKRCKVTLGPYDASGREMEGDLVLGQPHTLVAARAHAGQLKRERAQGRDPAAERRAAKTKIAPPSPTSFAAAVRDYVEQHCRGDSQEPRYRGWARTAKTLGLAYDDGEASVIKGGLCQRWGDRPLAEITEDDCFAVIDSARSKGIPGRGVRTTGQSGARERDMANALGGLFRWLRKKRKIAINPMAGLERPEGSGEGTRVLSDDELKRLWEACDDGPFGRVIKVMMLTGQRTGEVSGMRWSELGEDAWTIPAARAKNKREHVVPLAPAVQALIADGGKIADAGSDLVFTTTGKTPVSGFSKMKARLDARLALKEPWQLRDLRRTMVTGMAELGVQPHIIEACVNHVSGHKSGIAGIYNKAEYAEPKRRALERWAAHVEALIGGAEDETVVELTRPKET